MGTVGAGDIGTDGKMATRLQGQGAVRTSAPVNRGTHRDVPRCLQRHVGVNRLECGGLDLVVCRTVVAEVDCGIRGGYLVVMGSVGVGNGDVPRIQQQLSPQPVRRTQIDRIRNELQMLLA